MLTDYLFAKNIRFSCAYLFRIKIDNKYLLVKDEQGRQLFQPPGGVYKYTDDSFFNNVHAIQCTRFGYSDDLDCDLRLIIPRKYVRRFKKWYSKEIGRENPDNLYREFREEILDRISAINDSVFKTIKYEFCGRRMDVSRYGENHIQVHYADIVELIPTPEQLKELLFLTEHESDVYCFATESEIYNNGCINGNQIPTIAPHTRKILEKEQRVLKRTSRSGKIYTCSNPTPIESSSPCSWVNLTKADLTKPFTFISYNSLHSSEVWNFCSINKEHLKNFWIDRKNISENWTKNVNAALESEKCEKAMLFIDKQYLVRSTACYHEATLITKNNIPHIVVLVGIDKKFVQEILKTWIFSDLADKDKLRVFKSIFGYNNDTGHIDTSVYELKDSNTELILQAFSNISEEAANNTVTQIHS